jgi:hypothetical protein
MRVSRGTPLRIWNTYATKQLYDSGTQRSPAHSEVTTQGLRYLLTDREYRVERAVRFLENHRNAAPTEPAHVRIGQLDQIYAIELQSPRHDAPRLGNEPQDGKRGDGLTATGLAEQRQGLSPPHVQVQSIDGSNYCLLGLEESLQILYAKQGHPHPFRLWDCLMWSPILTPIV